MGLSKLLVCQPFTAAGVDGALAGGAGVVSSTPCSVVMFLLSSPSSVDTSVMFLLSSPSSVDNSCDFVGRQVIQNYQIFIYLHCAK